MFIAKNNDLIILTKPTREELEQALKFMVYTSIEETEENYILYNGSYMTESEILPIVKQAKYAEANTKAFEYLESGEAVFTYEEGKSIEATDGNIAKLGLYLVKFLMQQDYTSTIEWNTKENENVQLNAEQLGIITEGLGAIQSQVWTVKFPAYNLAISEAESIEEVNAIEIDYTMEI